MMSLETMAIYFVAILVLGIIGGVIFFVWQWRKGANIWPINVEIIEARANGGVARDYDMGKRIATTQKGVIIRLQKRKKDLPAIPLNFFIPDKKGNVQLKVTTEDNEIFTPLKFDYQPPNNAELMVEKNWDSVDYRAGAKLDYLYAPKPGWWQQYGNMVMFIVVMFMAIILVAVVYKGNADAMAVANIGIELNRGNYEITRETARMVIETAKAIGMNMSAGYTAAANSAGPW